jgi:CMP-N,N'-diacetyllegionaminic acid synthase
MRVLGIVPARGGSVRVPRKNTRPFGGRPLVEWAIDAALGASSLDRVVVSSDDAEVLALAERLVPGGAMARPAELATSTAPAIGYVRHALDVAEGADAGRFDAVVIVQPTSPFTTGSDIDATVDLLSRSGADSTVTVVRVAHDVHPVKLKTLDGDRVVAYLQEERGRMAESDLTEVYVRNGAVYAATRATIDGGVILGDDCRAVVMPRERSVDINDEFDLEFAEFLLSRTMGAGGS